MKTIAEHTNHYVLKYPKESIKILWLSNLSQEIWKQNDPHFKMTDLNHELQPHSLRPIHPSIFAELGYDLIEIMDRLGHIKEETTVNVYLHVTKWKKKETPNKFSELIRGLR